MGDSLSYLDNLLVMTYNPFILGVASISWLKAGYFT